MLKAKTLGERIKQAIDNSPFTSRAVAEKLGVTPQAISKAIKTNSMGKKNLLSLAKILNVKYEWLKDGTEEEFSFDHEWMAKCINAVARAAEELDMDLESSQITHAASILYKDSLHK